MTGAQLVVFPFLLLVLPALAVLAWWLKRRYAAAIVRLQQEGRTAPGAPHCATSTTPEARNDAAPPELTLRLVPADAVRGPSDTAAPRRLRRHVLAVQFAGGLLYWCALLLLLAAAVANTLDVGGVLLFSGPSILLFLAVPALVAWLLHAGLHHALLTVALAVVLLAGAGLLFTEEHWESALGFSFGYATIAILLSAFLRPSIRGAGLPLIVAGIAAWLVLTGLFGAAYALDDATGSEPASSGEIGGAVLALVLIAMLAAWSGWHALLRLSTSYAAKRFSDMQLALACYWALLTAFVAASVLKDPLLFLFNPLKPEWLCVGIVLLWLLWRLLQSLALARVVRSAPASAGALLFLRVFKPSGRSEVFTDRFFSHWRFAGPVWMIGGPDLAGAYLEPNEFFAFIRRRLRERVLVDEREAAERVAALDGARDPDGRFRVNELLCTERTWRPAVLQMIDRAHVIVLDLREYSGERTGTRFELTELLRRAALTKALVLADARDDLERLAAEVQSIWREVGAVTAESAELRILTVRKGGNRELKGLFHAALSARSLWTEDEQAGR